MTEFTNRAQIPALGVQSPVARLRGALGGRLGYTSMEVIAAGA